MSEPKILYQDSSIKLTEEDGIYSVNESNPSVVVLFYTAASNGYPETIGLLGEKPDYLPLVIEPLDSDVDIFATAKRGLKEMTGFSVDQIDKWEFLGSIKSSFINSSGNPSFSVDITGEVSSSDTSETQKITMVKVGEVIDMDFSIIHSLFLKTFLFRIINETSKNYVAV